MLDFIKANEYGVKNGIRADAGLVEEIVKLFPWVEDYTGTVGVYKQEGKQKDKYFFLEMKIHDKVKNARPIGSFPKSVARPVFEDFRGIGKQVTNDRFTPQDHTPISKDVPGWKTEWKKLQRGLYKSELVDVIDGEFLQVVVGVRFLGGIVRPRKGYDGYMGNGDLTLEGCEFPKGSPVKIRSLKGTSLRIDRCSIHELPTGIDSVLMSGYNSSVMIQESTVHGDLDLEFSKVGESKRKIFLSDIYFKGSNINGDGLDDKFMAILGDVVTDGQRVDAYKTEFDNSGSTDKRGFYSSADKTFFMKENFNLKDCSVKGSVVIDGATLDECHFTGVFKKGVIKNLTPSSFTHVLMNPVLKDNLYDRWGSGRLYLDGSEYDGQDAIPRVIAGGRVLPLHDVKDETFFNKVSSYNENAPKKSRIHIMVLEEFLKFIGIKSELASKRATDILKKIIDSEVISA